MQLLDSEQLEYAFQLYGINRDAQARAFYTSVWETIQKAEKSRDDSSLAECVSELRGLCRDYFTLMNNWRQQEEERHEAQPCCAKARDNAKEARNLLPSYEKQFYRYALCYLELNRALIHKRAHISALSKNSSIDAAHVMEVNSSTGVLLFRAHAERTEILDKRLRMDRVRAVLTHFDPLMERLGDLLPRHFGHDAGDHVITRFKGALRKERFQDACDMVRPWPEKIQSLALEIIDMATTHANDLRAQDGLMLHSGELSLIGAFLKGDEAKANAILEKYNIPYMVFQYRNLIRLGYQLGRIGSLESLIIQHAKLLSLAARPHNDPDNAQSQEQAVLAPVRGLMQDRFRTLGAIFDEMETTLSILEKLIAATRDYMARSG